MQFKKVKDMQEKLINLQKELFKSAMIESEAIQKLMKADLSKFKYFKSKVTLNYLRNVLNDEDVIPLQVEYDENIYEESGFYHVTFDAYKSEFVKKYGMIKGTIYLDHFSPIEVESAMKKNLGLDMIKKIFSLLKEKYNDEIIDKFLYLVLLNNNDYHKKKEFTYEQFYCLIDFFINLEKVNKLQEEATKIVKSFN